MVPLKKCANACRNKCVKIFPSICDNFTPKRPFYVNLYCQIASRIIPNLQQCSKKQTIWYKRASQRQECCFCFVNLYFDVLKHVQSTNITILLFRYISFVGYVSFINFLKSRNTISKKDIT